MPSELTDLTIALSIVVGAFIISWMVGLILLWLTKKLFAKTGTGLDDAIIRAITAPLRVVIIVFGVDVALRQVTDLSPQWGETSTGIFFVIYLVLAYIAIYRLIGALTNWYGKEVLSDTETELDDKFLAFFRSLAILIVTAITIIILLGRFGIEPSALVTTLGIGTLAVALAAQETLSDIISGFMIMLDHPFVVGDRVELMDINTWGDVTDIGLRSTRILTRDNRMVAVPNSVIGKGLVVNYSNPSTVYRVETHIGIDYGTDIDVARQTMVKAIIAEDWVMRDRPVEALLLEFGESALVFRVRCWIEDYVEKRRVIDQMNSALYKALNKSGIVIPMPQRAVTLYHSDVIAEEENEASLDGGLGEI